jgi:polyhydroxyalkanoate synthesis regulator phasin
MQLAFVHRTYRWHGVGVNRIGTEFYLREDLEMDKTVVDKILLATIGAMFMTRERAEEIFDEYLHRWQVEKGSRDAFLDDLVARSQEAHAELEDLLTRHVKEVADKLNLVTRDDLTRLEEKIDRIEAARGVEPPEQKTEEPAHQET